MSSELPFVTLLESVGFTVVNPGTEDIVLQREAGLNLTISAEECRRHKGTFYKIPHAVSTYEGEELIFGKDIIFVFSEVDVEFMPRGGEEPLAGKLAVQLSEWDDGMVREIDPGYPGVISMDALLRLTQET